MTMNPTTPQGCPLCADLDHCPLCGGELQSGTDSTIPCSEPLHTVTTRDRFGLVTVRGEDYQIVDIGMRMLEPHELFAAQGFPADYVIAHDANGKKFTKTAQVARCGNAVCPPLAAALVRANMPEMCADAQVEAA